MKRFVLILLALASLSLEVRDATAQFGGGAPRPRPPEISEPDANGDRMVTFHAYVPTEYAVHLMSPNLYPNSFNLGRETRMESMESGHWEKTIGPIPPGVYHYRFSCYAMSGLELLEEDYSTKGWNLLVLPGDTLLEMRDVPHGMVADIRTRYIPLQERFDHLYIYLPPDYETGDAEYPVLYLLGDGQSLLEVGRLNMILDNLIAAGKAQPMIVVVSRPPDSVYTESNRLNDEVRPFVEKNYRVRPGQANRAIAGSKSLDIALQDLNHYAYIALLGGWISDISDEEELPWEEHFQSALTDAEAKLGIRLILLDCQKNSDLQSNVIQSGLLLTKYGFPVELYKTEKKNGWAVYQDYLCDLLPRLFQPEQK